MNDPSTKASAGEVKRESIRILTIALAGVVTLACVVCCVGESIFELPIFLAFGWATHSSHLANELAIDWPTVGRSRNSWC